MAESISLEETNKIRVSLGLKPLTDDSAPADTKDQTAEDNFAKRRERDAQERERRRIQTGIAKIKNKRELNASLQGSTLGESDDVDDTIKWIRRNKKKAKELARKRQEDLENLDKTYQGDDYTEKDLAGLKVSHDFEALNEGEDRILTLKDSRILDNEEDELQNVELAEDERTKKNNELKIKKRDYTGYDDEEFVAGNEGMKRAVLAKYDEDISGISEGGFRLGGGAPKSSKPTRQMQEEAAASVNKSLLSIDYAKNFEIMDYQQEGDIGFKKPKTKKKRPSRRVVETDTVDTVSPPTENMDVDVKQTPSGRVRNLDDNFIDDEDLQAVLARQRRAKVKKAKPLDPEEIARMIAEERVRDQTEEVMRLDIQVKVENDGSGPAHDGDLKGGLEFDDTSEFVRAIQYNPVVKEEQKPTSLPAAPAESKQLTPARTRTDSPMETDEAFHELEAGEVVIKEEDEDEEDEAMLNAIEAAINTAEANGEGGAEAEVSAFVLMLSQANMSRFSKVGTSSEQTFTSGMASTLAIMRQQGILANPSADHLERERVQLQRDLWLAEQRRRIAQRELDRAKSRGSNKDQATREYENRLREQHEARDSLDHFKHYKPDVNIVYHDEFGRELTPKEAWKALSHRFHGKGSGKAKTEKRLKKIAEEKKKEAMASGDTPLSMNKAFQFRQEKAGQAHMVLSVGNRGAVPQISEFLDSQPLTKGPKAEKRGKKKKEDKTAAPQIIDMTGFTAFPTVQAGPTPSSASASPAPVAPSVGSPVPKPGFSRIVSESSPTPGSGPGTPVPTNGERTKVAFGFGTKRKATGEEYSGTPPAKKR
ncbi:SART-1 family-domain-containing protein [Gautieria morchelliformis]|nr:SART-1 family-domain-containing protein [Gautieria morchelliformis]